MLQIISQFITNEQELNKYEKANHADAFEYNQNYLIMEILIMLI